MAERHAGRAADGDAPSADPVGRRRVSRRGVLRAVAGVLLVVVFALGAWWWSSGGARREVERPLAPGERTSPTVEVAAPEVLSETAPDRDVVRGVDRSPSDLVRGAVAAGRAVVRGEVRTFAGEPVPDAALLGRADVSLGTADNAGRFEVVLDPGPYRVEATLDGHASLAFVSGELAAGEVLDHVRLVLVPTRTLRVEVRTDRGRWDSSFVFVELSLPGVGSSGAPTNLLGDPEPSGREGVFEDVPRVPLRVSAQGPHAFTTREVEPDEDEVVLDVGRLYEPANVQGRVVGPGGEPVAGAKVWLSHPLRRPQTKTHGNGAFGFSTFDPGEPLEDVHLLVAAEGYAMRRFDPPPLVAGPPIELLVPLERECAIEGVVVDANGVPVARAGVRIASDREAWSGFDWLSWAENRHHTTDADGRFRIGGLWEDAFLLRAQRRGEVGLASVRASRDGAQVRLVLGEGLERLAHVTLEVVEDATGAPVVAAFVGVYAEDGGSGTTCTAPDGRYSTDPLDPGRWSFAVEADGFARVATPFADYAGGEHVVRVRLRPAAPLRVRLVDALGEPVPGVAVVPVDGEDDPAAHGGGNPSRWPSSWPRTSYDGRCWFESLPAGDVRLRLVGHDGGTRWATLRAVVGVTDEHELVW